MKSRTFTLIEVVVALGVLALALTGMLQLLISSQQRLARSFEKWRETHMLMQAAEYYLLLPSESPGAIPAEFFPYGDYTAQCTYRDAENLPEEYVNLTDQLPLRSCVVELIRQRDRKTVDSIIVDKISYESSQQTQ